MEDAAQRKWPSPEHQEDGIHGVHQREGAWCMLPMVWPRHVHQQQLRGKDGSATKPAGKTEKAMAQPNQRRYATNQQCP